MGDAPRTYKDGHQFHNTQALEFLKERFTAEERATEAAAARRSSGQEVLGSTPSQRNKKSNIFFLDTARQRTWASDAFKEHDMRRGPVPGAERTAAAMRANVEQTMVNSDGSAAFPASARETVVWGGERTSRSSRGPGALGAYDLAESARRAGGGPEASARSTARSALTFASELGPDVRELQRKKAEIETQLGELDRVIQYKEKREIQRGLGRPTRPFAMLSQHAEPQ